MSTFRETNQARVALKMKLCNYAWYKGSVICAVSDGWGILVSSRKIDNSVRKVVPPVLDGVSVRVEVD
jgi:hypothetical protein